MEWNSRARAETTRGGAPVRTRLGVFLFGAVIAPLGALTTFAPNLPTALLLITVVTVGCQLWFFCTGVLLADLFPAEVNATAFGIIGAFGASMGLLLNLFAGSIIAEFNYQPLFLGLALCHPIGAAILWISVTYSRRQTSR